MAAKQRISEFATLLLALFIVSSQAVSHSLGTPPGKPSNKPSHAAGIKSKTYWSPAFRLGPGEVSNKNYKIEFPEGHIAIKGLVAEVVDAKGNSVPLNKLYLHHWVIGRLFVEKTRNPKGLFFPEFNTTVVIAPNNQGLCDAGILDQYFGLGSETRHTNYAVPDPYGIIVGDPNVIPDGFQEGWALNVHAIDTRATLDPRGCTECRCNLYNVSATTLPKGYTGGLACCGDGKHCALKANLKSPPRNKTYYLKYTVEWIDWDTSVVPVGIYLIDVTDTGERHKNFNDAYGCKIEYNVPACNTSLRSDSCVHIAETTTPALPKGGRLVYAGAHQHAGGIGSSLYKEDGVEICTSEPIYGSGKDAGDEAGYIVGMTSCTPDVEVKAGDKLRMQSRYSSLRAHTGVMGLFYVLITE